MEVTALVCSLHTRVITEQARECSAGRRGANCADQPLNDQGEGGTVAGLLVVCRCAVSSYGVCESNV